MEVGVCRVEERADVAGMPVAVILVAFRRDAGDGAWRLLIQRVSAYRRLPVEAQASAHLIALRAAHEQRSLPTPATYEVVRSHWLREVVSPHHARPDAVRHFVIAASYAAYDMAAEWCEVEASATPRTRARVPSIASRSRRAASAASVATTAKSPPFVRQSPSVCHLAVTSVLSQSTSHGHPRPHKGVVDEGD
jgi:hypothetical protein